MPISVIVNGGFGRMGQMVTRAISEHPNLTLAGQIGREYDLKKSIQDSGAQVVIDFTHPQSVFENTKTIIEAGAHPVIGTSGLTPEQLKILQKLAQERRRGGIVAPNFSIGAVLMMKCAQQVAQYMPSVEIIELHHDKKADSPSGTALRTAELISEASETLNATMPTSHETIPGARGALYRHIPIHSVRLPGFLAHQQVIFGSTGETLTLRHDSTDRACFMPGICLACEKVVTLDKLLYGLEEIL